VARKSPTGEKVRETTGEATEYQSMSIEPGTSQTRTVESIDAVTNNRASGLHAISWQAAITRREAKSGRESLPHALV
jgi:hypothetical protein